MARKIKSIEIEAFRGYDSKQLFKLTTTDGRLANLNVLYAPNGFGKTSFIDAVEWALTGQITRFQNSVILNTADRHAGNILHNYDSKQPVGAVQIVFEDGSSISRLTRNNRRNRQWDFNEGKLVDDEGLLNSSVKGGYRIVDTLTQESTDQSVCFTTPEQRFDALRPLWDSNNDTYIYKSLLGMGKIARDQKRELEVEIANLTNDIQISFKNQGVSTLLNQQLGLLNEVSPYQVEAFPEDINPSLLTRRLELLIKLRNNTFLEISSAKEVLESLSSLQSRFSSYNNNVTALANINKEITSLNSTILDANKLTSSLEILHELREQRSSEIIKINKVNSLERIVSDFLSVTASIENNKKNISAINKQIQENTHKDLIYASSLDNNRRFIAELQSQIDNTSIAIDSINVNVSRLNLLSEEKSVLSNNILSTQVQIDSHKAVSENSLQLINSLKAYLDADRNFFADTSSLAHPELAKQFLQAKLKYSIVDQKEKALKIAEESFRKLKSLNDTLLDIINLGRHFVVETQNDICPLCTSKFDNFEHIIANIDKQNINIDNTVDLEYYNKDLGIATKEYDYSAETFIDQVKTTLKKEESTLLNARNSLSLAENTIHSFNNHLDNINSEIKKIEIFFSAQLGNISAPSIDSAITLLKKNLENLKKDIKFSLSEASKNEELVSVIQKEIKLLNNAKNTYEVDNLSKSNLPVYSYGFKLLEEVGIILDDITILSSLLENHRKSIEDLTNKIDAEELSINSYFESTQGKSFEEINTEITILRSNALYISKEIETYTFDWRKAMQSKDDEFRLAELAKKSNDFTHKLSTLDIANSRLNDLIGFVESLKKSIELSSQLLNKQEQLLKVNSALNELEAAKEKSISYIEKKISQEFNEKLINDIYQKVEPHPTLKEIKFVPELDGDRAKLDILVKNDSKAGNSKAPVVYFSAAQINILSLSIFLAKSLQNEHKIVNTIFMDDPIQFLDSINTLSLIDLIRVITSEEGLNQQVFISTHDESFFKLLKRKIDPNYYASNFIELETFGVIKSL